MGKGLVFHDGHRESHAYTVIGAESGSFRTHPFTDDLGLYGVFDEIVVGVGGLLRHHVHMGLENDSATLLITGRSGCLHDYVTGFVGLDVNALFLAPCEQEFAHFFFVLGGTGLLGEQIEIVPNVLWREVFDCTHVVIIF